MAETPYNATREERAAAWFREHLDDYRTKTTGRRLYGLLAEAGAKQFDWYQRGADGEREPHPDLCRIMLNVADEAARRDDAFDQWEASVNG